MHRKHNNHRLAILSMAVLAASQIAQAQTTPAPAPAPGAATPTDPQKLPPNTGTVLQTSPDQPIRRSTDLAPVDASKVQPDLTKVVVGPKLRVKGFKLQGNTVFSSEVLLAGMKAFEGRDLTITEINDAAETIRDRYRNAGYFLAQALVPSQDVTDGIVEIRVVEGAAGKATAKVAPDARVSSSLVEGYLGLLPEGTLVTEQSVERPLLLLSDLPGIRVKSVLKPGTQFGSADLDLEVTREGNTLGGSVYLDNYGNRNTGEARLGADLEARGLLGMGDLITASVFQAEKLTTLGRVGLTVPVGPLGTKVSVSYTSLAYDVGGQFADLGADGDGKVASLVVQHPWIRSRNANLFIVGSLDAKQVEDRTAGVQEGSSGSAASSARRDVNLLRLGVNGDFRDDYAGGALNSYSLSLFSGDLKIKSADALAEDQAGLGYKTNGRFTKLQFEFQRLQTLSSWLSEADSMYLGLRGQFASKNLDTSEKSSLGGPRGVRAFPVGAGSADDSVIGTVEYRRRLIDFKPLGATVVLSAFLDYGTARIYHKPVFTQGNRVTLGGAGLGVNFVKKDDFQLRLDVATRVGGNDYTGDESEKRTRGWAVLQKWF
jgi:hemolysin activation/secretion protein